MSTTSHEAYLTSSSEPALPAEAARRPAPTLHDQQVAAVFFDLDGTLVETDDETVARLARRLAPFRSLLPGRNVSRAARHSADWINASFNHGLAVLDWLKLDEPAQRLAQRWGLIRGNSAGHPLAPVAGTIELVQALYGRYLLGIVSSRTAAEVRIYLAQQGLAGFFAVIAGSDTTERIKPHPQPILWAASQLGVDPSQVVMVGDTEADVEAAKAAGALAVGVLCGFGDRTDLQRADLILPSTADLVSILSLPFPPRQGVLDVP